MMAMVMPRSASSHSARPASEHLCNRTWPNGRAGELGWSAARWLAHRHSLQEADDLAEPIEQVRSFCGGAGLQTGGCAAVPVGEPESILQKRMCMPRSVRQASMVIPPHLLCAINLA